MVGQFRDYKPTLSEVAKVMGTSRQNLKQLAIKLENKDLLKIEKDENDSRIIRLSITKKSEEFWEKRQDKDIEFITNLFKGLTLDEIDAMYKGFNKLYDNILKFGEKFND